MQTIHSKDAINALITRIGKLENNTPGKWGKMNVTQMIKHCILSEEMYLGKTPYKRLFVGKVFGKMALKKLVSNDAPIKKNQPTHKLLKTAGNEDIELLKEKWTALIQEYQSISEAKSTGFVHPFFGKMTKSEFGIAAYKHIDHHLRQFGV